MDTDTDPLEDLVDSTGNGILDVILRYGLYLGAVFQLICIFAVIFVPTTEQEKEDYLEDEQDVQQAMPVTKAQSESSVRRREKKKRR